MERNKLSPKFVEELKDTTQFTLPNGDDSSIGSDLVGWNNIKKLLDEGVAGGTLFDNGGTGGVFSTYSLVYTTTSAGSYYGGVLAPNGDIHFVPGSAPVGQKVSPSGVVSTYSLVYTTSDAYFGGVLAPNGDIHFVPYLATVGQKVNPSGVVSTYSLVVTSDIGIHNGGVLAPNGDIHFVPFGTTVGQKVSPNGTVSTYSLVFTGDPELGAPGYSGGVLAPNGDIHFVPYYANVGQKVSPNGTVSTYSLVSTTVLPGLEFSIGGYSGGVLAPNGDIHFVPTYNILGQKVNINGTVSTYSLVYTGAPPLSDFPGYFGGVLVPNGDIHFISQAAFVGQKVNSNGIVSTYSIDNGNLAGGIGGILAPNGDVHLPPYLYAYGIKLSIQSGVKFPIGVCLSGFFNKF